MASYTSATSAILSSPTFTSISTTSSFDFSESRSGSFTLSAQSFSLADDSDDEIVWTVPSDYHYSSDGISTESSASASSDDDDFVVLRRPLSSTNTPDAISSTPLPDIASDIAKLSLDSGKDAAINGTPSPKKPVRSRRRRARAKKEADFGARSIVDDVSEDLSFECDDEIPQHSVYDEAVRYVTSFLHSPADHDSASCRLVLLQSIIIELGLATSTLPASLTSAKAILKSSAFLNIREYLAVRDQGLDAVKQVMYPSRTALIKSIRKQPNKRASLGWVKEHGLQVLLVSAYRH